MKLIKMSGTGNDFLIADLRSPEGQRAWQELAQDLPPSQVAAQLCHRQFGIGSDGLILVKPGCQDIDFIWDFYNSDGSSAEMCGNAARCVSRWFAEQSGPLTEDQHPLCFQTQAGLIRAQVHPRGFVSVEMSPLKVHEAQGQMESHGQTINYSYVDSGVPHIVLQTEGTFDFQKMKPVAEYLRNHPHFGEEGANVTFVRETSPEAVHSVSFERGVEDFTLACGTGAVAAAWAHRQQHPGPQPIQVQLPGGQVTVSFQGPQPILYGPAHYIAEIYPLKP